MQVKIFSNNNIASIEEDINKWLANGDNIKIIKICQSESYTNDSERYDGELSLTISVWYETK